MKLSGQKAAGGKQKLLFALVLASGLVGGPSASQAGLFDFLFGPAPTQRGASQPPDDLQPPPLQPDMMQQPAPPVTPRNLVTQKPENTSLCCKHGENPRNALMADPTLRPGDAVMMAGGISIFEGEPGAIRHAPSDFASLAQAQTISPESRAKLQSLDRHSRRGDPAGALSN